MRAAIFNPYLDTLGGGERYTMAFATSLIHKGYSVDIEWKDETIKSKLEKRFGINLTGVNFIPDVKKGDGYDVIFWVGDGSIPLLRARNNMLHFQIPFRNVNGRSLLNKMKLIRIGKIVCNSNFTKSVIDKEYGVKSLVLYPPVDTEKIKPKRKENLIIYVGRFSELTQLKGQDVLIEAFNMFAKEKPDWKMVIAGGSEVGAKHYLKKLQNLVKNNNITLLENPPFDQIKDLYGKARIFWSAAGYGVDEIKDPKKVEHFGITVVEAMSGGSIPFLYNAGGHKEIITDAKNGFLWNQKKDLIKKTISLINNQSELREMSLNVQKSAKNYSYEQFNKTVSTLL